MNAPAPSTPGFIGHPLLSAAVPDHGFGTRSASPPEGLARPRQVHGITVARATGAGRLDVEEADAAVSDLPGVGLAIVTADCVPILLATASGTAVAAIHAGWRGLAAGVVERGLAALGECVQSGDRIVAGIGPRIGPCCYEVDEPVMDPLRGRFGAELDRASSASRPGHFFLDLGQLVARALRRGGLRSGNMASLSHACTACEPARFHSYRRDGESAGRLLHYIVPNS
ncbi:MAG: polyphenol oxidase family protein [Myxococcota bacterium]|nr:polyphenol oxidase family protein [Myxococcota bacterium]